MNESLIKPKAKIEFKTLKLNISETMLMNMQDYMVWAGFEAGQEEEFILACLNHVLEGDKKYKKHVREIRGKRTKK